MTQATQTLLPTTSAEIVIPTGEGFAYVYVHRADETTVDGLNALTQQLGLHAAELLLLGHQHYRHFNALSYDPIPKTAGVRKSKDVSVQAERAYMWDVGGELWVEMMRPS